MPLHLTDEQLDIINAAACTGDNLMIDAYAGCGKSSTLLAIERAVESQPILYLVFNTENAIKIASEDQLAREKKKPAPHHSLDPADRVLSTTCVRTFNSCGHRIWADSQGRNLKLDPKKSQAIFKELTNAVRDRETKDVMWAVYQEVISGVGFAKSIGYVPEGVYPHALRLADRGMFHSALDEVPDELTADLIDKVLKRSIQLSYEGTIDYNDQVYMPALFGGTFPKYPLVLVDEYQDLSPVNHALLERLARGRIIGVGDPYQNIYGFRGAAASGMSDAIAHYRMTNLPLSVSFRCPSEIVKHVHWRVPRFRWLTTGGSVECPKRFQVGDLPKESTIICRNNAPLFRCAMQLLASGRSISVSGSDIGPRLTNIMRRLGPETMGREAVIASIEEWRADRLERESKTADDIADCMLVFAAHGNNLQQAIAYAEHLFTQRGRIQLTTGHKAKGLEWSYVLHLDPWLVRRDRSEQDMNLDYVISTRSRDTLIEIDSEALEWQ